MLIGFIFRVKLLKKSSESSKQDDCYLVLLEAVVQRCSVKKMFLEISQNSQKSTCARVYFLIKLQAWGWKAQSLNYWPKSKRIRTYTTYWHKTKKNWCRYFDHWSVQIIPLGWVIATKTSHVTLVTRVYVSDLIKQILKFYDNSNFVFFQFQEKKEIGFDKLFFRFFFYFNSILFLAFAPLFTAFSPWFPAFWP